MGRPENPPSSAYALFNMEMSTDGIKNRISEKWKKNVPQEEKNL